MYQTIIWGSDNDLYLAMPPSTSSNFFGFPARSLSLRSKSSLLHRLNQSLHVVSHRTCSPYASWRNRWLSVALLFNQSEKAWFKTWNFRCYKKCNVYKWKQREWSLTRNIFSNGLKKLFTFTHFIFHFVQKSSSCF